MPTPDKTGANSQAAPSAVDALIPDTLADLAVPVADLTPYHGNPRRGHVPAIVESLRTNGQYRPVVVRRQTGEVLAGNHTLAAAVELGWDRIAATFIDCTEEQAARIVLADNRTSDLGGYDDEALLDLLRAVAESDEDGTLGGTGYAAEDLDMLAHLLEAVDVDPLSAEEFGDTTLGTVSLTIGNLTHGDVSAFRAMPGADDAARLRTLLALTEPAGEPADEPAEDSA